MSTNLIKIPCARLYYSNLFKGKEYTNEKTGKIITKYGCTLLLHKKKHASNLSSLIKSIEQMRIEYRIDKQNGAFCRLLRDGAEKYEHETDSIYDELKKSYLLTINSYKKSNFSKTDGSEYESDTVAEEEIKNGAYVHIAFEIYPYKYNDTLAGITAKLHHVQYAKKGESLLIEKPLEKVDFSEFAQEDDEEEFNIFK